MTRTALVVVLGTLTGAARPATAGPPVTYLDQGWTADDRRTYYALAQGSEIIPYPWFLALEQAWAETPFRADDYIDSFRYLPEPAGPGNPDGLPVGFAKGKGKGGKDWFGLTCAACHTGQFTYRGKTVRVDGGTTLADLIGFQAALTTALEATAIQPAKFDRFARKVLGNDYSEAKAKELAGQVRDQLQELARWGATSRPAHPTGFGVWDAVNILMNTVNAVAPGEPANYRVPQAPVSYPSVWLTNQYDALLVNAAVENVTLRQVGEVIIVFGRAKAELTPAGAEFGSSADLKALRRVYDYVYKLSPPKWPEGVLGPIDRAKAERGREVYCREGCAICHPTAPYPTVEEGGRKYIKVVRTPIAEVGTDPTYAEYFVKRTATPGRLAPAFKGTPFEGKETIPAAILFLATLTKITEADLDRATADPKEREALLAGRPLPTLPKTDAEVDALVKSLLVYKATPLAGVWATGPYLHNGSVPTLYELLLPPAKRAAVFHLGDREFDPKGVGYRVGPFEGGYRYDTSRPGFSNRGHEYGTTISDDDRWALVEYLKTL